MPPICRCSSPAEHAGRQAQAEAESHAQTIRTNENKVQNLQGENSRLRTEIESLKRALSPANDDFEIEEYREVPGHLILKVKYKSCEKCSYEGVKVLVFEDKTVGDVLKWRRIDPHFRAPDRSSNPRSAPSPIARFPASDQGWADAFQFATLKSQGAKKPGTRGG